MIRLKRALCLLVWIALPACGDEGTAEPLTVDAGPDRIVASCEPVRVEATTGGGSRSLDWTIDAPQPVVLRARGDGVEFRAPSVVVPTTLTLRADVRAADGGMRSDVVRVEVQPQPKPAGLADGMAWDCAPFLHGVASGDPRPDGVVLWTRLTPESTNESRSIHWQMALDPQLSHLVREGEVTTEADRDFTIKLEVGGLEPATTYYFQFIDSRGRTSPLGRTKTAPSGVVEHLRFAVASCSSIYSGYFNAYRRISERSDLDLVIHLGDYLYDFVDENEQVRVPDPYPTEPATLEQWRERHAYYLADPDLRLARAAHPWAMIPDNHDLEARAPGYNGGLQAFREWNPLRDEGESNILYRKLEYGDLVDLILIDALLHRDIDTVPGTQAKSILGNAQFDWLASELRQSEAAWRVIGNQRLLGTVRINPVFAQAIGGEPRDVFDTGAWDGYPEDRSRLLGLLVDEHIDDNVVISGDSHVSAAMDLVDRPLEAGAPSAGVEFLPTSISRGNFDETLLGLGFGFDQMQQLLGNILADTARRNPHHRYLELTMHGYGILDIRPGKVIAHFLYSDILDRQDEEFLGKLLSVERGTNRWVRSTASSEP